MSMDVAKHSLRLDYKLKMTFAYYELSCLGKTLHTVVIISVSHTHTLMHACSKTLFWKIVEMLILM